MGSRIAHSLSWSAFGTLGNRGLSLAARLILARLLTPEVFGLLAIILVVVGLVAVTQDLGIKQSLIQRRRETTSADRYSSGFWFLLASGIIWTILLATVGAPIIGEIFDEPNAVALARVMSLMVFFQAISIIPEVRLIRTLRFKYLIIAEFFSAIASLTIAIIMALLEAGAWALVAQQTTYQGIRSLLFWRQTRWRPRWRYDFALIKEVWRFSSFSLGSQIVNHIRLNIDKVLLGAIVGSSALGAYTLAYLVTETIRAQIGAVVARVMFPVFSQKSQDIKHIRNLHLRVVRYMCLIVFPFAAFIGLEAQTIIPFLFGTQWSESVLPTTILSLAAAITAINGDPGSLLKGIGKPGTVFYLHLIGTLLVGLPAITVGAYYFGAVGAAYGVLIQTTFNFGMISVALYRNVGTTTFELLKAASWGAILAIAVTFLCWLY